MLEFKEGDMALVRITNHGYEDVYFNIIDIEPSGKVNPVMPDPGKFEDPRNFRIMAGKSFTPRKVLQFYPPFGTETYKIFASYEAIDLSPILRTRGSNGSRGLSNPLEVLFQESYTLSRGTVTSSLPTESNVCTFAYTFRIVN